MPSLISNPAGMLWPVGIYNVFACALMGYDKYQACHRRRRVPEKTLFTVALTGGSVGILSGMYLFHHKTRHLSFTLGVPAIIVLQLGLLWYFRL